MSGSVESYAHKAAKAAVVDWLRSGAVYDQNRTAAGLSWRVNRGEPWFGVWEEYPILNENDVSDLVWDETQWWRALEMKRGLLGMPADGESYYSHKDCQWLKGRQPIPTFDELYEMGRPPRVILDVAVQHKGRIVLGIEIVHKHGLHEAKRQFLKRVKLPVYVVRADWVLNQVRPPSRLKVIEALSHWPWFADVERDEKRAA
jgi:hypothetical protein